MWRRGVVWFGKYTDIAFLVSLFGLVVPHHTSLYLLVGTQPVSGTQFTHNTQYVPSPEHRGRVDKVPLVVDLHGLPPGVERRLFASREQNELWG